MVRKSSIPKGHIRVAIESVHSGHLSNVVIDPRVSVKWLVKKACQGAGLRDIADIGALDSFPIRWVLIDTNAESDWAHLSGAARQRVHAMIRNKEGLHVSHHNSDRLESLKVYDGITFHLHAIADDDHDVRYCILTA